jgi:hypothetical protein
MCFVKISGREVWRKLHSEKLHSMQFAVSLILLVIIKDIKFGVTCSMDDMRIAYKMMVVQPKDTAADTNTSGGNNIKME